MNSEQLGLLLADVLDAAGGAVPRSRIAVRRPREGDADLASPVLSGLPAGVRATVVQQVTAHPEVAWAGVDDGGVLRVRLTEPARARALRSAPESLPAVDLRAPARPVVLSGRPGRSTPDAAAEVVGPDAVAYALARGHRPGATAPLTLDVDAAVRRTPAAPLFAVQWAHVRAAALADRAARLGVGAVGENVLPWGRTEPAGLLAGSLVELPATVARAVRRGELAPVPRHLEEVAGLLLGLEPERRFLPGADQVVTEVHRAGVDLVTTAGELLARVLDMLGVEAPRRI